MLQDIINTLQLAPVCTTKASGRPALLYYLRLEFPHTIKCTKDAGHWQELPLILYKLGYTTTTLAERVHGRTGRYITMRGRRQWVAGHAGMGLPLGTNVFVISTLTGTSSLVYAWEQALHRQYAAARYRGALVMSNGNTELYVRDILGLDC